MNIRWKNGSRVNNWEAMMILQEEGKGSLVQTDRKKGQEVVGSFVYTEGETRLAEGFGWGLWGKAERQEWR